jgi:hypothetical protein
MTHEINYFKRVLKYKCPTLYDKVSISVSISSDYQQSLAMDGIMRTELNYHYHSSKQDVVITFPNIGGLYYDVSFLIRFVWCTDEVVATFDYSGTNYFKFTTKYKTL